MINLNFEVDEVNIILSGLGELPAKLSMGVIQKIHQQVAESSEPASVEEVEEGE
jgi:lipase chaperone LimK